MTAVVIYNEFKPVSAKLTGGERDNEDLEILAGAQRQINLVEGQSVTITGAPERNDQGDRVDGPTISEYVAAGFDPATYPPKGFSSRSSQEEIDAAVLAQPKTAPTGLKTEQVPPSFTPAADNQTPWARQVQTDADRERVEALQENARQEHDGEPAKFDPPPKASPVEDPRTDEQKAMDKQRVEADKQRVEADKVRAGEFTHSEPPIQQTSAVPAPYAPSNEPLPGIANLNEAENRISAPKQE